MKVKELKAQVGYERSTLAHQRNRSCFCCLNRESVTYRHSVCLKHRFMNVSVKGICKDFISACEC